MASRTTDGCFYLVTETDAPIYGAKYVVKVPAGTFGSGTWGDQQDRWTDRELIPIHGQTHIDYYGRALRIDWEEAQRTGRLTAESCSQCNRNRGRKF